MRKTILLLFSIFYSFALFAQGESWRDCEFPTLVALDTFDTGTEDYHCTRVFILDVNKHYYFDGTSWLESELDSNISTADDTLTSDRVLEGDSKNLTFTGIGTLIASAATSTFRATSNILYEADKDESSAGEHQFYTGSTEQVTIENAGTLDLLQYGDGTYEDNANNTFDLGVDSSGNLIEVDRRVSKINTTSYSYSSDRHNLSLNNLTTFPYNEVYRINPTNSIDITGIDATGVKDGQRVTLLNINSNYFLYIRNQHSSSSTANRIITPNGFTINIYEGGSITFIYDATSSRWRIYAISSYIDPG